MRASILAIVPVAALLLLAADEPTREQKALARDLDGRVAGEAATCVSSSMGSSLQVVDQETLVYREGRTIWVSKLGAPCPGLRPLDTLIVEVQGSQYCRGDRFRTVAPGSAVPGAICLLGDFTPWRRAR